LFLSSLCTFLVLGHGVPKASDEISMMELTRSLLYEGTFEVSDLPLVGVPGRHGELVSKYGLGQPVLTAPFDLAGAAVSSPLNRPNALRDAIATAVVPFASAGLVAWSYVLARRMRSRPSDAAGVACCAVVGGFVLVYATEYFAEAVVALLLVVAVERASANRWSHAYAALAVALVVHPRVAPAVAAFGLVALWRAGLRRTVGAVWPLGVAVGVILAYNVARFGSPFETGYADETFSTPLLDGLTGLFLIGSKSILIFAPLVVVGAHALWVLRRAHTDVVVLIASTSVATLLSTAMWHSWQGGWAWGPRFLAPVVPLMTIAIAPWLSRDRRRWGGVIVLAIGGFLVSAPALVASTTLQLREPIIGPSILDQYAGIPDVVRSALDGECRTKPDHTDIQCMPAFWQVHVARTVGPAGDGVVMVTTVCLVVGSVLSGRRAVRAVHDAESMDVGGPAPASATISPEPRP